MQVRQQWWLRGAFVLPVLVAGLVFVVCHFIILNRMFYPYELEWIEGGSLQVVVRILQGLPVYSDPTPSYVAPLYMPLFFYVSAISAKLLGIGLPALRMVSYLSAVLAMVMVSRSVWIITRSRMASLLGFLCCSVAFKFNGQWFDVARVDSLWAFWLMGAVSSLLAYRYSHVNRHLFFSAFFYVMAVFTKQSSLMLAPFFLVSLLAWSGSFTAAKVGFSVCAAILGFGGFLQWQTGGWFYFYTMEMARSHEFTSGLPWIFLLGDLLVAMPVLFFMSLYFCISFISERRDFIAYTSIFSGFFVVSLMGRWYSGGYSNVLMPFHYLWVVFGVSGFFILASKASCSSSVRVRFFFLPLLVLLLGVNIAWGYIQPASAIPTAADRACGDDLLERLKRAAGEVCISRHGYLAYLAGKSFCAHEAFAVDLFNGSNKALAKKLTTNTYNVITGGHYAVLVLDTQAQFDGYGVHFDQLRYTATDLDCPKDAFYPVVRGQRPLHWLEYNGVQMNDLRNIR